MKRGTAVLVFLILMVSTSASSSLMNLGGTELHIITTFSTDSVDSVQYTNSSESILEGDSSYGSAIAFDSEGNIHVVFKDNTTSLLHATNEGGQWVSTPLVEGSYIFEYDMAIDSNDHLHISYYDPGDSLDLMYLTDVTGDWVATAIDTYGDRGMSNSIAIDSNDNVHILYTDSDYDGWYDDYSHHLYYATNSNSEDGTWDTELMAYALVTRDEAEQFGGVFSTDIEIDSNDKIHATFHVLHSSMGDGLWHASGNLGSWDKNRIDSESGTGVDSAMAFDSNNGIHIVYSDTTNSDLKYSFYNETNMWNTSVIASEGNTGWSSSLALDVNNRLHVTYYDADLDQLYYAYSTSETTWMFDVIPTSGDLGGGVEMILGFDGNIHVTYDSSDNTSTTAWYTLLQYPDFDGDGISSLKDACPQQGNAGLDVDSDGCYDDSDGDGIDDHLDQCPTDDSTGFDTDLDGCVDDSDGDGVGDDEDALPNDPSETTDSDFDGYGDNSDQCEGHDDSIDVDTDGIVDGCDNLVDNDGDGVANENDSFPNDSTESNDTDLDGIGDNSDLDIDGDNVSNVEDAWPFDHTRNRDTDGDGLADYVEGFVKGELIDFESGDYDGVSVHCAEDLIGFCMPDYAPWVISSGSISGEYSISQRMWASDTGYFSISFSSLNQSAVTLDVFISDGSFGEVECIPIFLDNVAVDYGCVSEGFSYYDSLSINVSAGEHELKFYGTILGQGNRVDNIQLPDYIISFNEDTDDDDDGWLDQKETGFEAGSPCLSDPLDPTSTPGTDFAEYYFIEFVFGMCYYTAYDTDEDGIIDFEDKCPKTFGVSGAEDVHGCPVETKGSSDSISTKSMQIGGSVGLILFAGLIGLFLVRRRRRMALEKEFDEDDEEFYGEDFYDEMVSSFSSSNETSQLPPLHAEGQQIDGYETIEYPTDSGTWYYRDEDSGEWIEWV
jgi:hypothetical protein